MNVCAILDVCILGDLLVGGGFISDETNDGVVLICGVLAEEFILGVMMLVVVIV